MKELYNEYENNQTNNETLAFNMQLAETLKIEINLDFDFDFIDDNDLLLTKGI